MALLSQPHFGEVGHHGELTQVSRCIDGEGGHRRIAPTGAAAGGAEPASQHPVRNVREGEAGIGAAQVSALVAVGQPAGMHRVEGSA